MHTFRFSEDRSTQITKQAITRKNDEFKAKYENPSRNARLNAVNKAYEILNPASEADVQQAWSKALEKYRNIQDQFRNGRSK